MERKKTVNKYITQIFETPSGTSSWFGYYNYDTLNSDQTKMLGTRPPQDGVSPAKGMFVELGYYDIPSGEWHKIGESDSWNWQQGAMMQWIKTDGGESIIYNCSMNNRIISCVHDLSTGENRYLNWPIYGITPDGKKSISIEMERSYWCRAYHYQSVANPAMDGKVVDGDGIFEIDILNNTRKRIISIQDIIAADSRPDFGNMKHWVEHVMINQAGTKFCFLHRFSPEFDVNLYQTRLIVADIDGSNMQTIPDWDKVDWSHFGWNGNNFSIYTVANNKVASSYKELGQSTTEAFSLKKFVFKTLVRIARMLPASVRKRIKGGQSYYQYYVMDSDGNYVLRENFNQPYFDIDGHPSFTNDGRYMITDSYPDSKQYQRLIVFDLHTKKGIVVAQLYASHHKTPSSCDLHPKLCRNNNYVVVDSANDDKHHQILFELNWKNIKEQIS